MWCGGIVATVDSAVVLKLNTLCTGKDDPSHSRLISVDLYRPISISSKTIVSKTSSAFPQSLHLDPFRVIQTDKSHPIGTLFLAGSQSDSEIDFDHERPR